jgi:hypothetical protein
MERSESGDQPIRWQTASDLVDTSVYVWAQPEIDLADQLRPECFGSFHIGRGLLRSTGFEPKTTCRRSQPPLR